jgi:hypothetical protein
MIDIVVVLNLTSSRPESSVCLHYGTCLIYDNHSVDNTNFLLTVSYIL